MRWLGITASQPAGRPCMQPCRSQDPESSDPDLFHNRPSQSHTLRSASGTECMVRLAAGCWIGHFSHGVWVQKVVYFPSDNSDLLRSHFSVQSEVHYFWTVSGRILVYSQKQSILRACRVCRSHLSELSQPLIFCFGPLPVQRYCNQSSYPY